MLTVYWHGKKWKHRTLLAAGRRLRDMEELFDGRQARCEDAEGFDLTPEAWAASDAERAESEALVDERDGDEMNEPIKDKCQDVFTFHGEKHWLKIGTAYRVGDGSLNVELDALPTNARLNIRERETQEAKEQDPDDFVCPDCGCDKLHNSSSSSDKFWCPDCSEESWRSRLCTREVYEAAEKAKGGA